MGKVTGFLEIQREQPTRRPVEDRLKDWQEIYQPFPEEKQKEQGARCMDCGVPFCHTGCPVNNLIPDWNDLVYNGRWETAIRRLHATNNFPEFTGRICPAPCEAACVLGINQPPVSIKLVERSIVERAWEEGWIKPEPPQEKTGKRVAIVGSGPAGLAAAQQLRPRCGPSAQARPDERLRPLVCARLSFRRCRRRSRFDAASSPREPRGPDRSSEVRPRTRRPSP